MASKTNTNPRILYLTDDIINTFSGINVLTTYRDVDLRIDSMLKCIDGGPLDSRIFGSCFSNQCNCGLVRKVGKFCPNCSSRILDEASAWTRYARIDLPVYYCNSLRFKKFIKFMNSNFKFSFDLSPEFKELITKSGKDRASNNSLFWNYCQFMYDDIEDKIVATDKIDDYNKCSYEGLLEIIIDHYPNKLNQFRSYINSSVLVTPLIIRAPFYTYVNGKKELQNHKITTVYKCILYATTEEYDRMISGANTEVEKAMIGAVMRKYITSQTYLLSRLLKASKANIARTMQSHRIQNSGRCTIIPDPNLKVDEVTIPRHLMYECCKDEFIQYLMDKHDWTFNQAEYTYLEEANTPEVQLEFTEYIEHGNNGQGKYVIINRNPSLYELSMQACKVKLTNNYTMGIPLLLCAPFGGDFDGDTFSFYSVPDEITPEIVDTMSPKNLIYYKKNLNPLYTPSHEIMGGLMVATKVIQNPEGMMEFTDVEEANNFRKKNRSFKWQTACIINSKITTLARTKLSELFGTDLDNYLDGFKNFLTSKEITELYIKLSDFDDRTERIQAIQEFALMISTLSGATAPKLSELHANINDSYIVRIREIEQNELLSDREKDIKIREIYEEYQREAEHGVDENGNPVINEGLKLKISESARAKMNQLLSIVLKQLSVGPDQVAHVSETTLIDGMNPTDYARHAIENRATQDIKVSSVPNSGYTTRQLVYLGTPYVFSSETDPTNKGIRLRLKNALGRTLTDGTVVTPEMVKSAGNSEEVMVRSIVTCSTLDRAIVTGDCLTVQNKWKDGDHVGISLLSSLTEGLTQSGLSLKHGGNLFQTDKKSCIKAPETGIVTLTDHYLVFKADSGKEYVYAKSNNLVVNYSPTGKYQAGDTVAVSYHLYTPSYRLDSVIKLIGANKSHSAKRAINNQVIISECYAYSDGKLRFEKIGNKISKVIIGNHEYAYNPNCCYFIPEGTEVKAGQRFCTGLLNLDAAIGKMKNYIEVFYLFRTQFEELIPGMQPELIEFVYSLIVKLNNGRISRKSVVNAINETPSMYTRLAFQNAKRVLQQVSEKGAEFLSDTITSILLPSFFNQDL